MNERHWSQIVLGAKLHPITTHQPPPSPEEGKPGTQIRDPPPISLFYLRTANELLRFPPVPKISTEVVNRPPFPSQACRLVPRCFSQTNPQTQDESAAGPCLRCLVRGPESYTSISQRIKNAESFRTLSCLFAMADVVMQRSYPQCLISAHEEKCFVMGKALAKNCP